MVCPTHATPPGPVHAELVQSFRQTSVAVREVLRGRVEGERAGEEEEADDYDSESDEEPGNEVPPFHPSLIPRPLPDFISPWLQDKIWEWPDNEAISSLASFLACSNGPGNKAITSLASY